MESESGHTNVFAGTCDGRGTIYEVMGGDPTAIPKRNSKLRIHPLWIGLVFSPGLQNPRQRPSSLT